MNNAARLVIVLLGIVAIFTTIALCANSLRTGNVKDVKEIAIFVLGAIAGVLAKTGIDPDGGVGPVRDSTVNVTTISPEGEAK